MTDDTRSLIVTTDDGVELSVSVTPGAGTPVLLVHGFGSAGRANWHRTGWLRSLAGSTVVTVDLRGHGNSSKPLASQAYRLDRLVADLATAAQQVAPDHTWDLVGYSLGGRVVCDLATVLPVRRMVVGGYDGGALLRAVVQDDLTAAFSGEPAGPIATRLARIATAVPGNDLPALQSLILGLSADPSLAVPAPLPTAPTLVVAGALDPIANAARAWSARLPHGRWLEVPDRDHISVVTARPFRDAAVEWLRS